MNKKQLYLIKLSKFKNRDRFYSVIVPSPAFIKKHPLCINHSTVFIKTYRSNNSDYNRFITSKEFEMHSRLYLLFKGKHIPKCLGKGPNYIVYEALSLNENNSLYNMIYNKKISKQTYKLFINTVKNIKQMIILMHNNSISYGDALLNNILITQDGDYYLVDYERAKYPKNRRDVFYDIFECYFSLVWVYVLRHASKNTYLHKICVFLLTGAYKKILVKKH